MRPLTICLMLALAVPVTVPMTPTLTAAEPLKVLLLDGQNNHNWKATTPLLRKILEDAGMKVEVSTAPAKAEDMAKWTPAFKGHDVVVSNYNGTPWSKETQTAFDAYVKTGGGFVAVHAANNSFPAWLEYNEMIGVGGWGGRNEKSGPYIRFKDDKFVRDESKGNGGSHGKAHPFVVSVRNGEHPITKGLPKEFMHAQDELYDRLRGPAKGLTVLATAFADKSTGGSGEHEPMLMVIDYGKGRVFHTTLGHDTTAIKCVGFAVTLQRGAEWAATGKVTQKVPEKFPSADKVLSWE